MREGIHLFAAYAAVEWLIFQLGRALFPSQTIVPISPSYAAIVFAVYIVAGALVGLVARERSTIVLVALFAVNAFAQPSRFIRYWTLAVALVTIAIHWRRERPANPILVSLVLLAPLFVATELLYQRSLWLRGFVAFAVLLGTVFGLTFHKTKAPAPLAASVLLALVLGASTLIHERVRDAGEPRRDPSPGSPNVVLVTLDTVRADHLSLYGYARRTTPALELFAHDATRFTHAYAPSNMTLASHASMFTGTFATQHGAHATAGVNVGVPLSDALPTASEVFARRGYRTLAVVSNYIYLGQPFGVMRGFQLLDARPPRSSTAAHAEVQLSSRISRFIQRARSLPPDPPGRRAAEITELALDAIDEAHDEKRPFFLFVNYLDAHAPYVPPPPFDRMFDSQAPRFDPALPDRLFADMVAGRLRVTPEQQRFMVAQYDGAIRYVDSELGKLLEGLRSRGIYDQTLIVITSDHGETFGERGFVGHGSSLFDDQIRVPLLVKRPGQRTATIEPSPISLVQVASLLVGDRLPRTPVISESFPFGAPPSFRRAGRSIVDEGFKLIVPERGAPELYDLHDRPANNAAAAQRLQSTLAAQPWLRNPNEGAQPKLDPETERRLRALGYLH